MRSILIALCLVATASVAQKSETAKPSPVQRVDFSEIDIGADRLTPLGEIYVVPPRAKFNCLIQRRMNFNDKLRESVHEM